MPCGLITWPIISVGIQIYKKIFNDGKVVNIQFFQWFPKTPINLS